MHRSALEGTMAVTKDASLGKIVHKGRAYYAVSGAARLLSTTASKIRELIGGGELEARRRQPPPIPCRPHLYHPRKEPSPPPQTLNPPCAPSRGGEERPDRRWRGRHRAAAE